VSGVFGLVAVGAYYGSIVSFLPVFFPLSCSVANVHVQPEVAGIDEASLHQTALAVLALARLRDAVMGLGPDLALPVCLSGSPAIGRSACDAERLFIRSLRERA
jgi:hypothetical protein